MIMIKKMAVCHLKPKKKRTAAPPSPAQTKISQERDLQSQADSWITWEEALVGTIFPIVLPLKKIVCILYCMIKINFQ